MDLGLLFAAQGCRSDRFFRAVDVHFETDLHLLGLLILEHPLEHRNLSPHAPGDLGNLIDDLHLRNLHVFLHSGCSEHLRLRFLDRGSLCLDR